MELDTNMSKSIFTIITLAPILSLSLFAKNTVLGIAQLKIHPPVHQKDSNDYDSSSTHHVDHFKVS